MFIAIYYFKVKEGRDEDLIKSWAELTKLIYQYCGSLGSRLHSKGENEYIAYAQWPDRETWNPATPVDIPGGDEWRTMMRDSCEEIKTLHELEVEVDLLKDEVFKA